MYLRPFYTPNVEVYVDDEAAQIVYNYIVVLYTKYFICLISLEGYTTISKRNFKTKG